MKKFLLTTFIASLSISFFGQSKINAPLVLELNNQEYFGKNPDRNLNVFVKGDLAAIQGESERLGGAYRYGLNDIASVVIPATNAVEFAQHPLIERVEFYNSLMHALNDSMLINCNVDSVHLGMGNLPEPYDGSGVVVGAIDLGLEFDHKDFMNADSSSRILYLWDQAISDSTNMTGSYNYGYEYTSADIDADKIDHQPYVSYGHGTNVTGIMAGNGTASNKFKGVAPKAHIVYVNIRYDANWITAFTDGLQYIFDKANALGLPCSINSSVGSYSGSHDGTDLTTQFIEYLVEQDSGRVLVQAAGNGGNKPHHINPTVDSDTAFTMLAYSTFRKGYYFDLYADKADFDNVNFSMACIDNSTWTELGRSNWLNVLTDFNLSTGTPGSHNSVVFDGMGNKLADLEVTITLDANGVYEMYAFAKNVSNTSYVWDFSFTGSGTFDVWSHRSLIGGSTMLGPTNVPTTAVWPRMANYVFPDVKKSIVGSWNCSDKVISVGNYNDRASYVDYGGVLQVTGVQRGSLAASSSKGPTRDNRRKPEIASSGSWTLSPSVLELMQQEKDGGWLTKLATTGLHRMNGGTSMSAPTVAGGAALFLQMYPRADYAMIRQAIMDNARIDQYTEAPQYGATPNDDWGFGKFDAYQTIANSLVEGCTDSLADNYNKWAVVDDNTCLYNTSTNQINKDVATFETAPNPFQNQLEVKLEFTQIPDGKIDLVVADQAGRNVQSITVDGGQVEHRMTTNDLAKGFYLLSLRVNGVTIRTTKVVKM